MGTEQLGRGGVGGGGGGSEGQKIEVSDFASDHGIRLVPAIRDDCTTRIKNRRPRLFDQLLVGLYSFH